IIIAGLIKNREYKKERKLPLLGDIPVLGNLFKSKSTGTETKELVVFLTPHIISGGEDLLYVEDPEKARKPKKE
ncbi:MAG: type II and III secretion system protein, partial [Candidatus Omnitrophica bacterium]|nr:type II and III secretion system protein [Candidatus Omnitrophota bacterium]